MGDSRDPGLDAEYVLILENLNEGVWRLDEEGRTVHVTRRMAAMLGYEPGELAGARLESHLDPKSAAIAARGPEFSRAGVRIERELVFLRRGGGSLVGLASVAPVFDAAGVFRGTVVGVTDVSARRAAEDRLKRLARVVESAGQAIYITDRDGVLEYVNPAFTEMTGFSPAEALGRTPKILKSGLQGPEYYKRLWETILAGRTWREEVANRRKDGRIYLALQTVAPILDEAGRVEGFTAIQIDVTQEKELERAVRESEERYRAVVSSMREGVLVQDAEGRVLATNDQAGAILGRDYAAFLGRVPDPPDWRAVHEDGTPFPDADWPIRRCLRDGRSSDEVVLGLERPDGSLTWISISTRPILGPGGAGSTPTAAVATFADITERKRRESEIIRAAETDYLTGIDNRRKFYEHLERESSRAARYGEPYALLMIDLDRFKSVNDRFGHDAGDRVLVEASRRARAALRESDSIARWGGEEFIVLAPRSDEAGALLLAERLRAAISSAPVEGVGAITASLGVAVGAPGESSEAIARRADEALYAAKQAGRDRCVVSPRPRTD